MVDANGDNIDTTGSDGQEGSGASLHDATYGVNIIDQDDTDDTGQDNAGAECLLGIFQMLGGVQLSLGKGLFVAEEGGWMYGDSETGTDVVGKGLGLIKAALAFSGWVNQDRGQSLGIHAMNLGGVALADGFRVEAQILALAFIFDGGHGVPGVVIVVDKGQTIFKGVVTTGVVEVVFYGVTEYLFAAFFADGTLCTGGFEETGGADKGAF